MIDRGKRPVIGVGVNVIDMDAAVAHVIAAAHEGRSSAVSALAVHGLMTGATDPVHRYRLNALDLVVPDGQPVRWALRLVHRESLPDRVYGPDLMLRVCGIAAREGLPIYLYGSRADVLDKLSSRLRGRIPGLDIAGTSPSRFRQVTDAENTEILDDIRDSGARIVFVGLGCPRQEVWAYENTPLLSLPVLAVGAAFDFHAGLLPQAPRWMQDRGLEWLFRLIQEPKRLWQRYLILNSWFCCKLAMQVLRLDSTEDSAGNAPSDRANHA